MLGTGYFYADLGRSKLLYGLSFHGVYVILKGTYGEIASDVMEVRILIKAVFGEVIHI